MKLPAIEAEKYRLDNGLQVILHEDHAIPMAAVNIWYHVGSKNEKRGKTGFAHLFEHMMFEGSEHNPDGFFEPLEKVGANLNGSTSEDRTNYWEHLPSQYLELALWMESDRMGYLLPAIDQEKLDNQIDVVRNERRQRVDNQPYGRVHESLLANMYPYDHPYSWPVIGSMEDIAAATLEDVKAFFSQFYTPNNASLCIAGDFDPAQAKEWVQKYFGEIPSGPPLERMKVWTPTLASEKRILMEDQVALPRIYLSWPSPALFQDGDAELDILANVLSSGKDSRLYKRLVYETEIAQDVVAYQSSNEICSTFDIVATAKPGKSLDEIEDLIDSELQTLLDEGPTKQEVATAINGWEARFVRHLQAIGGFGGKADLLNQYNVFAGTPTFFNADFERYSSLTPEAVHATMAAVLPIRKRITLSVKPVESQTLVPEAKADRKNLPPVGTADSLTLPAHERVVLGNGLPVYFIPRGNLPLIHMNLIIENGGSSDPLDKPGVANITARLLAEGTENRSALEISRQIQSLGAILSASSSFDYSMISLNVLEKHLDPGLDLMTDVLLKPTFPEEELARNKKRILARILQENKDPFVSSLKAFFRNLYGPGHPYGQPYTGSGSESSINKLVRDDLVTFYENHYRPNNAALIVAGDFEIDKMAQALESHLGSWQPKENQDGEFPDLRPLPAAQVFLIDKPDAVQSVIAMGHYGQARDTVDFAKIEVMNSLLGGKFTSRINMNLREDKGFTYGARSLFIYRKHTGPYLTYAPVHTQYTKDSITELLREFAGVRGEKPVTEEELVDTKNNLILGYPGEFDTIGKITNKFSEKLIYRLPDNTFERYIADIKAVTSDDVVAAAQNHIQPDQMQIVVVGDRKQIEPGIRELDLGEIHHLNAEGEPLDDRGQ